MAINIPFLSNKPERPKTRELKLHEEVHVKKPLESFPEIVPALKGKVVSAIDPEHKLEVQPIYRYVISAARKVKRVVFASLRETLDAIPSPDPADGKMKLLTDTYEIAITSPPILVEFAELQGRRFYIPANQLETKEQYQWRLDHKDDPSPEPEPDPASPSPTPTLPPEGSMALPVTEEVPETDATSKQTVGT